ncbi:PINIT domain-containing protein [Gautieria morchelliformis]|nr:PINIT domain-containing protein [Gautieria morchelliformis]
MASSSSWADFEGHKSSIRHNTVAKLQSIISGWTDQCRVSIPKSGKKADLIDRMTRAMNEWRDNNQFDKWLRAKAVIDQVRETGQYSHYAMPAESPPGLHPQQAFPAGSSHKLNGSLSYPPPAGAGPAHLRYDAYAPPRKAAPSTSLSSSPVKPSPAPGIRFKSSPFLRVVQPVSQVIECPESTSALDRRSQSLTFTLTPDQLAMLDTPNSRHQLRLYCTSSLYHVHHHTGFRTEAPCPIEFPATCEVRVNNVQLGANLKGLKKKPGTAPPPDLGKAVKLGPQVMNRVDMVYVNSQQPVQHKKFYMVVHLVEVTTVEQLVEKLKKGKYKSEHDVRAKMIQTAAFDDDIVAGPQKMSLRCPLSYMRVNTPCRSIQCPHAQCFDATSWFSMMEQTTTWLCPVCDKVLNVEELIIDGYFDRILMDTPESVDDVMVEPDGEWHTSDNKIASAGWRASYPVLNGAVKSASPQKELAPPAPAPSSSPPPKTANAHILPEIITLSDSEDDEERIVKQELSPRSGYTTSQSQSFGSSRGRPGRSPPPPPPPPPKASSSTEVIDLTLDSDDEVQPPVPSHLQKRKERENDDGPEMSTAWKRQRYSGSSGSVSVSGSAGGGDGYGGYPNGIGATSSDGVGLNGNGHLRYGDAVSSGTNDWGPVRIPIPAPPQSSYQAPISHATSSSTAMPVLSQHMNGAYINYNAVPHPSMAMSQSPLPAPRAPYYNNQFNHPSGHHMGGDIKP